MNLDERITSSVQWARPDDVMQKIQAKQEILKSFGQSILEKTETGLNLKPHTSSANHLVRHGTEVEASRPAVSKKRVASGIKSQPSDSPIAGELQAAPSVEENTNTVEESSTAATGTGGGEDCQAKSSPGFALIGAGSNEMVQGKGVAGVGHTAFLAAVWMLRARKDLGSWIRGLFIGPPFEEKLKYGVHSVSLFVRGKWRVYTIDDCLPVDAEFNFIFTSASDPTHLWAALLEKAVAKSFGSYSEMGSASPLLILQRLTGGVGETIRWAPAIDSGAGGPASVASQGIKRRESVIDSLQSILRTLAQQFGRGVVSKEEYVSRRNQVLVVS